MMIGFLLGYDGDKDDNGDDDYGDGYDGDGYDQHRMELNMKALELEQEQRLMEEQRNEQLVQRWAEKHHYLLSTQTVPGIYNSPYRVREPPVSNKHFQ